MPHIKLFEDFVNERYYSPNHNLYKVANSSEPVMGPQIFTPDEFQNFDEVQKKLETSLEGYKEHMKIASEKMKGFREAATGQKGEKGNLAWYDQADKTRNLAFEVVTKAADYMTKHNKLYDSLKKDLMSEDHVKVAKAITAVLETYPNDLITAAGKLKRMKTMKLDGDFVKAVIKWTNSIMRRKDMLEEAAKMLGKTAKQIEGARKQAAAQRARWGSY